MKPVIAVALSGGIDSLVAASLLIQKGFDVFGIHFVTGFESPLIPSPLEVAAQMKTRLGIDVHVLDVVRPFRQLVVDYFVQTYLSGKTPNPCLVCNPLIKFGAVLEHAESMGATHLATGHYAQITAADGVFHLLRGIDPIKDQSYFLSRINQRQLAHACFPLGGMVKSDVVRLAGELGLQPVQTGESQDICFIRGKTYGDFLMEQNGFVSADGPIMTVDGNVIGRHPGLHLFTIGQRRGINCPAAEPYYVVRIDRQFNTLVVGFKSDLTVASCRVSDINWIAGPPEFPARVLTRVRYRSPVIESTVFPMGEKAVNMVFDTPQPAVTPGQGAVFYSEDGEVWGGGWICGDNVQGNSK